jgi:crossover junction endodeoxyribonuclease RuvC
LRHQEKDNPHGSESTLKEENDLRIIGIDPGSIFCGYGLIQTVDKNQKMYDKHKVLRKETEHSQNTDFIYITSGRITLSARVPLYQRLKKLHGALLDIMRKHKPNVMVIERMFFAKSVRAAISLGQARGIALLAAASEGLNIYEYSALEVKKAVTGYGGADKRQVQDMVMRILNIKSQIISLTEDSADALALALCHLNNLKLRELMKG